MALLRPSPGDSPILALDVSQIVDILNGTDTTTPVIITDPWTFNVLPTFVGVITVPNGGTGRSTLTNHGVLVGAGASAITQLAVGGANTVQAGRAGADPAFTDTPTLTTLTTTGAITSGNTLTVSTGGLVVSASGVAVTGNSAFTGTMIVTSANAAALSVGRLGATTPALLVDGSTGTSITGVKVKAGATGTGVTISAIGETNVSLLLAGIGTGIVQTTAITASASVSAFKAINSNSGALGLGITIANLAAFNAANHAAINFTQLNASSAEIQFGRIRVTPTTTTAGAEDGAFTFEVMKAGTLTGVLSFGGAAGGNTLGFTYNTNARFGLATNGTLLASGGLVHEFRLASTLQAVANSDNMIGLRIIPTLTPGAFTGLVYYAFDIVANSTALTGTKVGINIGAQTGGTVANYAMQADGAMYLCSASGTIGIGAAPVAAIGVTHTQTLTGAVNEYGYALTLTSDSSATTNFHGFRVVSMTTAASTTVASLAAFKIPSNAFVKGASGSVTLVEGLSVGSHNIVATNLRGVTVGALTGGTAENVAVDISAPSGAALNLAIRAAGPVYFSGGSSATVSGFTTTFGMLNGYNTGDNPTGNVHANFLVVNSGMTYGTISGVAAGQYIYNSGMTITSAKTVARLATLYLGGASPTVSGTLTNNNTLYLESPSGGSTVNVIASASGATLPTSGSWTNNPSWASYKSDITYLTPDDLKNTYELFMKTWKPATYRYSGDELILKNGDTIKPQHQDGDFDSYFAVLDDMDPKLHTIICSDINGAISTKDMDGFLAGIAITQGLFIADHEDRITKLEAKVFA